MTLEQIEHVLRELGWDGKPGDGPRVHINGAYPSDQKMWIEKGLVVLKSDPTRIDGEIFFDTGMEWREPSEIKSISLSRWPREEASHYVPTSA
jgi:hypothetical protein